MSTLTADAVGGKHQYLAHARPDWRTSMATIRGTGGPWRCPGCGTASLLVYLQSDFSRCFDSLRVPMLSMAKPPKEQLYDEYYNQKMSYPEIADRYGVADSTVGRWMREYDIGPGKGGSRPIPADKGDLERMYYDEGLSQTEIAEKFDVSQRVISSRMREHGIAPGKRVDLAADASRVPWATYRTDNSGYEMWRCRCGDKMHSLVVHRLAMVAWEGFDAVVGMKCHHKNGIKWDNREDNIELLTDSEHKSRHANEWDRDERGRFRFS